MRSAALLAGAALALGATGGATAQSRTAVEQLAAPSAAGERTRADQVKSGRPAPNANAQVSARDVGVGSTPQISTPGEGGRSAPQLAPAGAGRQVQPQLATGPRSAQPSDPLSTISQGRDPRMEALVGEDRCDPPKLGRLTATERRRCNSVIERRSAEFQRPAPNELSSEERLLRFRSEGPAADARNAARSLAAGQVEGSEGAQAIAAAVNRPDRKVEDRSVPYSLTPPVQLVIEAVTQGAAPIVLPP